MKAFKKKNGIESRLAQAGIRMVLPSMLIIAVFTIYPIFQSLIMSFTNWNILKNTRKFVGLNNYTRMFADERFLNALKNTVEYTLLYVPLLLLLCILFAALINFRFKGASFYKSVMFVPAVTSMAIIAIIFRYILDGNIGIIPLWLKKFGVIAPDFLRDEHTAMGAVIFTSLWRWTGFNMVIILAGINAIPESLYEASAIDGAGNVKQFFSVTLPLIGALRQLCVDYQYHQFFSGVRPSLRHDEGRADVPHGSSCLLHLLSGIHRVQHGIRLGNGFFPFPDRSILHRLPAEGLQPSGIQFGGISHEKQIIQGLEYFLVYRVCRRQRGFYAPADLDAPVFL